MGQITEAIVERIRYFDGWDTLWLCCMICVTTGCIVWMKVSGVF